MSLSVWRFTDLHFHDCHQNWHHQHFWPDSRQHLSAIIFDNDRHLHLINIWRFIESMSHHNLRTKQVPRVRHNINAEEVKGHQRRTTCSITCHSRTMAISSNSTVNPLDSMALLVQFGPTGRLCYVFTGQDPLVLVEDPLSHDNSKNC